MEGICQTCSPGTIPNYNRTFGTPGRTTLTWAHPAGYGPGTSYEILRAQAASYCAFRIISNFEPIAQTTQTSFDLAFAPAERFLCYAVRVASCPSVITSGCFPVHNFSSAPQKPNLISAVETAPGQVTITYSHDDERGPLVLQRARIGEPLLGVTGLENCPGGPVRTYIDEGPTGLAPATYRYRLATASEAGASFSDEKVVVVGADCCVAPQEPPQVSSPDTSLIVGQEATVVWTATEVVRNYLIELARDSTFSTLLHTIRLPGTSRRAALRFPAPGTYFARVVAERICGRKEGTPVLSFSVSPLPAVVAVTARPSGMLQLPGQTATDSYTLTNFGGSSTTIRLSQVGEFFSQAPLEFTLAPRASQIVTLTAPPQADGNRKGQSVPTGEGVAAGMSIPVFLLTAARPAGSPDAQAERNRIDLATPPDEVPLGVLRFTNRGSGTVRGILVSDAPWIVPDVEFAVIEPGQTGSFTFRVSRLLRPRDTGTAQGRLALIYLEGAPGKLRSLLRRAISSTPPPGTKTTLVTVTDTVKPTVSAATIPPLPSDQIAFFVPGVGHLQLGDTTVTTDVSILNADSLATLDQLQIFLTTGAGSSQTSFSALAADQTLKLADVTKSVFNSENQVGSLQLRTGNVGTVSVSAALSVDTTDGARGTAVPVFRSDKRVAANESLYLAGLSKGASSRTDLYLQEMAGQSATGTIEFLSAAGATVGSAPVTLQPYAAIQWIDSVPEGAVAAVVTNTSTTGGTLQAYATPVDLVTNDSWSVADWSRQYGYSVGEPVVIPIAGKLHGLSGSAYQTDLAILNSGLSPASGTLSYFPEVGPAVERLLSFGPRESRSFTDVIANLFQLPEPTVGYLVFTPAGGSFVATSRTYRLVSGEGPAFSAAVPALALSSALGLGEIRKISGIEDSTLATSRSGKPGTARTNFGMLETAGAAVTVRATLRYTAVEGSASAVGVSSRDYALQPRQFLMMSSLTNAILQERRGEFGDLSDIQVDFEVIDGAGRVMVFLSTLDNATSDAIVRTE